MGTNQTIDGVSREEVAALEKARDVLRAIIIDKAAGVHYASAQSACYQINHILELRALLDTPACNACNDTGRMHEPGCDPGACTACIEKTAAQPRGEPVAIYQAEFLGEGGGGWSDVEHTEYMSLRSSPEFRLRIVYAEQPAPVAVEAPEIVGRQCFPSAAMKAVHGYRKTPWVDGKVDQVPSEPGFYRVEPLVRLSDVTAPVAVVLPTRQRITPQNSHDWDEGHNDGWKAYENELKRLNPSL